MRLKKNLSIGVISMMFGVIALVFSWTQIGIGFVSEDNVHLSPSTFPRLAAVLLLLFGFSNIIMSLVFHKDSDVSIELKKELRVLAVFAGLILDLIIFKYVGFIISTSLIGCFILFIQADREKKHYLFLILLIIAVFLLFKYGLHVAKLPWGYPLRWLFGK